MNSTPTSLLDLSTRLALGAAVGVLLASANPSVTFAQGQEAQQQEAQQQQEEGFGIAQHLGGAAATVARPFIQPLPPPSQSEEPQAQETEELGATQQQEQEATTQTRRPIRDFVRSLAARFQALVAKISQRPADGEAHKELSELQSQVSQQQDEELASGDPQQEEELASGDQQQEEELASGDQQQEEEVSAPARPNVFIRAGRKVRLFFRNLKSKVVAARAARAAQSQQEEVSFDGDAQQEEEVSFDGDAQQEEELASSAQQQEEE